MGKPASSKEIDRLQTLTRDITAETLKGAQEAGQFKRFPDSALAAADPRFSGITSFLPQGMRSSIPTQYQGMQGQMYANYQTPQKLGEQLTPFGVRSGQSVPVQTGGIGSVSTPLTPPAQDTTTTKEDDDGFTVDQEQILANINIQRINAGLEPFDSYQDFLSTIDESLPDNIRLPMGMGMGGGSIDIPRPGGISGLDIMNMQDLNIPSIDFDEASIGVGFADGGIAALQDGGFLNTVSKIGSALAGLEDSSSSTKDSKYENMSREQLIALLKGKETKSQGLVPMIANVFKPKEKDASSGGISNLSNFSLNSGSPLGVEQFLNLPNMADGGDVDFPRMNGPISGPGTETSDDIPAMLSDGEFVVNAKAVRGIGKIGGANKSKADQRKEGARMMYALQRAGEQAMRGRS